MKWKIKAASGLLCLLFLFSILVFPSTWVSGVENTITITSEEEWKAFASNCTFDAYSRGKTVLLAADLDFSGGDFTPAATFGGTFDGNNHTIRGFTVTANGSVQGLFRYVQEGARVQNLHVTEASVTPQGSKSEVGGIAGINQGTIADCTFSGKVSGKTNVGGIAGRNEATGVIENCRTEGAVQGEHFAGGMVGQNYGIVAACKNSAEISASSESEPAEIDFSRLNSTENVSSHTDVGGIAGYSSGILQNCRNEGKVGYPHVGYNIGGIAGRQNGYLSGCINEGEVFGRKDVGGVAGQLEPLLTLQYSEDVLQELSRELAALQKQIAKLPADLESASAQITTSITRIQEDAGAARGFVEGMLRYAKEDAALIFHPTEGETMEFETISGKYRESADQLTQSLRDLRQTAQGIGPQLASAGRTLSDDIKGIAGQIDTVLGVLTNAKEKSMRQNSGVQENSDENISGVTHGKVGESSNYGKINGDVNVGGIVGSMAVEYDFDPEDDIKPEGNPSLNAVYERRAVLYQNTNRGQVIAKKDHAGGIVGQMDFGTAAACESYGAVTSTGGDYAGGIAGKSKGLIRDSFVLCPVSGKSYVSGVAGSGQDIVACLSLVRINASGEAMGAIAGQAAGEVKECYYVQEDGLAGIDGISYEGKAVGEDYQSFVQNHDLPDDFHNFKLTFLSDGEVIYEHRFQYGESLSLENMPEIPQKEGYYAKWPAFDYDRLTYSAELEAIYYPWRTVIASGEMRGDDELPLLLAEGSFVESAALNISAWEESLPGVLGGDPVVEAWSVTTQGEVSEGIPLTVRYLPPEGKDYSVWVYQNQSWRQVEVQKDGRYLVFSLNQPGVFAAAKTQFDTSLVWKAGTGVLLLAIGAVSFYAFLRKKRRKQKHTDDNKKG